MHVCVCEHAYQSSGQLFLWKEAHREASGQVAPAAAGRGLVMPRLALQEPGGRRSVCPAEAIGAVLALGWSGHPGVELEVVNSRASVGYLFWGHSALDRGQQPGMGVWLWLAGRTRAELCGCPVKGAAWSSHFLLPFSLHPPPSSSPHTWGLSTFLTCPQGFPVLGTGEGRCAGEQGPGGWGGLETPLLCSVAWLSPGDQRPMGRGLGWGCGFLLHRLSPWGHPGGPSCGVLEAVA